MDTNRKFLKFEQNLHFIIQYDMIILYHMLLSWFFFFLQHSIYSLRIGLEVSSLIQKNFFFFNHQDNKLSRLLAVILAARINGTISKNIN